MSNPEHKIELTDGYTDKKGVTHKDVTFGRRLQIKDIIALDMNPMAQNPTQYERMIRRQMITKFGSLALPVDIRAFLALDSIDDDLIGEGADEFLRITRGERSGEVRAAEASLMIGFEIDGISYDVVRFGNRLTVQDYVEADRLKLTGAAREVHKVGRQIGETYSTETGHAREGQLTVEQLSGMDSEDFNILRIAAEFFRLRLSGKGTGATGTDKVGTDDSKGDGLDGEPNTESAAGKV